MIKISVVTCVYNLINEGREESFRQTVESVHNQSYKNIEHIIVYTPGTDNTKELIEEYSKKGWVKCYEFSQKGIWAAMQAGIRLATGDYINFLNSDDYFINEFSVEKVVDSLVKNHADWAFGDALILYPEDSGILNTVMKSDINKAPFAWSVHHQTMFISMDVMSEIGGFDLKYKISLDNHMIIKLLLLKKKYVYVEDVLVAYRSEGWSTTHSLEAMCEDYAINFYDQTGKSFGLTLQDCRNIWYFGSLNKLDYSYYVKIAKNFKLADWKKTLLYYSKEECRRKLREKKELKKKKILKFKKTLRLLAKKCYVL